MNRAARDPAPLQIRKLEASRLFEAGRHGEAQALLREVLDDRPDDGEALNMLACVAVQRGRPAEALRLFKSAHKAMPDDPAIAANIRGARQMAHANAEALRQRGDPRAALEAMREVLAIEPGNPHWRNLVMHLLAETKVPARISDYAPQLREAELGTHIVIACMPKSGSTFLDRLLRQLTEWDERLLTFAFLQNEEELHLPYLVEGARRSSVTQQHFRATEANIQLLQAFAIRPLVQVRNLFDVVVSYADFFDAGATINTFFARRWDALDRGRRLDLVIDNFLPWYFAFYASWMDAIADRRLDCAVVRYEDLIADKLGVLRRISDFYALGKTAAQCEAAVAAIDGVKSATRFNKGGSGRGAAELSPQQKKRVRGFADYFPDIDFAPVGL